MGDRSLALGFVLVALTLSGSACASTVPTPAPLAPTDTPLPTLTPIGAITGATPARPADVPVKPQKGFRAPDFALPSLEEKEISLSDFHGQLVVLNFWATWCDPCREELPVFQQAFQSSEDLVVLGVNLQEGLTEVRSFVEAEGLTFPVLLDREGRVAQTLYRVRGLPTSFLLNAEGIIAAVHIGPMTADQLEDYMAQARGE